MIAGRKMKKNCANLSNVTKPILPPKGYYVPMVLSNGEDFCQIDFTGSMAWRDQIKGYMSFWYKKGRPNSWHERGIAKFKYEFTSDIGPIFLGNFTQYFNPVTAILKTHISGYQLKMEIDTFLTEDHTLIEIYRIIESESLNSFLSFNIAFPDRSNTGNTILLVDYDASKTLCLQDGIQSFHYAYKEKEEEFAGIGLSGIKLCKGKSQINMNYENAAIEVTNLSKGDLFVRVSTLMDSINTSEFEVEAKHIHSFYMEKSEEEYLCDKISEYSHYSQLSSFGCSNNDIEELFNTSMYVCKAAIHSNGSAVSTLEIPNNHGMGTYWDIWYTHAALLRANRIQQAMKILNFWDSVYPKAKKIAKDHGVTGARFEWLLRYDGTPYLSGITEQIHNNLIPVLNIYEQYIYTADKTILFKRIDLMLDCVRFVLDFALRTDAKSGKPYIRKVQGCDEYDIRNKNDLLTTAVTLKAIEVIIKSEEIMGRRVEKFILNAKAILNEILIDLKKDGIYMVRDGATVASWATALAYLHHPHPEIFNKVKALVMEACQTNHGMSVGLASNSMVISCPWMEGILSWTAAINRDHDSPKFLNMMTQFTNYYGGLCETIFTYGEPSRDWFVAAHGVFIAALVDMLIQRDGDEIIVFPCGVENLSEKINFSKFRLPGAILVSLKYDGKLSVLLENLLNTTQKITLKICGYSKIVSLESKSHFEEVIQLK